MLLIVFLAIANIMNKGVISIGTNLGDKLQNLKEASFRIQSLGCNILKQSSVYETEPWGFYPGSNFLNQVIELETNMMPGDLLDQLLKIEKEMGRERSMNGYESRIIDLDILFYGNKVILEGNLVIPHPLIQDRRFILIPLNEILPNFQHPVIHKSISELLDSCRDNSWVTPYLSITKPSLSR